MRITNNMMSNTLLYNLNRNMFNMTRLQEQGADGKRVHRPSDDPIAISKILKLKSDLEDLDQYKDNIRDSLNWYQVTESSVVDLSSAVSRIRDLAVQAANTATNSPEDLKEINAEIKQLRKHIVNAGNFSYAGKYVFSGYQNDKPLLKTEIINGEEVVSYNVDITDRDVARPQKMRYEVGQAEEINVTTHGLEIFGVVTKDYNEYYKTKFRLEGSIDKNKDYSTGNMEINIDGETFKVDNSILNGTASNPLTEDKIKEAFMNASYGDKKLSDIAEIKFEQDNLIIESKTKGKKDISFTHTNLAQDQLTLSSSFRIKDLPVTYALRGDFDLEKNYTANNINVLVNGEVFNVDTSQLNGSTGNPFNETALINAFNNADNNGKKLSQLANISYSNGKLTIENKAKYSSDIKLETDSDFKANLIWKHEAHDYGEDIDLNHNVNIFNKMFTDSSGSDFAEGIGVMQARFDASLDYTNDNLDITLGGTTYDVDEKLLNGTKIPIDKALILERYRKAKAGNEKLEDIADIYFDSHDNLVIKAKELKKNKLEVDLSGTTPPFDVEVDGKIYKVNDLANISSATNAAGNPLSDVVDVNMSGNDLTLTSKGFDNKTINIKSMDGTQHHNFTLSSELKNTDIESASNIMKFSNTKTGIAAKKAQLVGNFSMDGPDSDYRNSNITYNINGKDFTVDTSHLTGNGFKLKAEKVLEEIRNAKHNPLTEEKLSDYADVFFNQEGKLVVKHKEFGSGKTISLSIGPKANLGAGYQKPGYTAIFEDGVDSEGSVVKYNNYSIDDDYIKENEKKLKETPIFITYNGERHKIKIDKDANFQTLAAYKGALQDAIDKTIGEGSVTVDIPTGEKYLTFSAGPNSDGLLPEVQIEPVVTKESSLIRDIDKFIDALDEYDQESINEFLADIDTHVNRILAVRADIGSKTNRMELASERTKDNVVSFTKALSNAEDVDLAETIMQLKNFENVYKASLSMGSKIIQPSLIDFIR